MTPTKPAAKLLELWKTSSLIQGTMALAALAALIFLAVTGQPIPEILIGIVMTIIGFYFGTKKALP